jgi:ketosteroid isomerase-like protein
MVGLWNSGDIETWLDEVGPEFVFTPDPTFPDAGIYKGEALREWMRDWVRTWKDNRFELLDYTEIGDASLCRSRWHLEAPDPSGARPSRLTIAVWWDGPDRDQPNGCVPFFQHQEALAKVR